MKFMVTAARTAIAASLLSLTSAAQAFPFLFIIPIPKGSANPDGLEATLLQRQNAMCAAYNLTAIDPSLSGKRETTWRGKVAAAAQANVADFQSFVELRNRYTRQWQLQSKNSYQAGMDYSNNLLAACKAVNLPTTQGEYEFLKSRNEPVVSRTQPSPPTAVISQQVSQASVVTATQKPSSLENPSYRPKLTSDWVDQGVPASVKLSGATLYALNGSVNGGLLYFPRNRSDISDFKIYVEVCQEIQVSTLKNPTKGEIRFFKMNGHEAGSFEVTGETNGMRFTYFLTVVDFQAEVRDLNMWSLVSNFDAAKPSFEEFARQLGR